MLRSSPSGYSDVTSGNVFPRALVVFPIARYPIQYSYIASLRHSRSNYRLVSAMCIHVCTCSWLGRNDGRLRSQNTCRAPGVQLSQFTSPSAGHGPQRVEIAESIDVTAQKYENIPHQLSNRTYTHAAVYHSLGNGPSTLTPPKSGARRTVTKDGMANACIN